MANRNYPSAGKIYSLHVMPVTMDCRIVIGSSGAVSSYKGAGISNITKVSTGRYKIQFADNFNKFLAMGSMILSPVTGSALAVTAGAAALTAGVVYQITTVGTTTAAEWVTLGLPAGITAAAGQTFVAATTGTGAGTGFVKALGVSGIATIEALGDISTQLAPTGSGNQGGYIIVQTLAATNSSTTTLLATNPTSGSTLCLHFLLSNSSVAVPNE